MIYIGGSPAFVLGMVNIGGSPAFILGVAWILAGVGLYALRSFRPELSRDHDIFFAAIALTSGAILMFQGWRLDPFLFLGYLCASGSAAFFGVENIRMRGITTEQAKRNTPITDRGRSVSRRYDYEPQDYDYDQDYDYRPERGLPSREDRAGRRIRATRDSVRPGYGGERPGLRRPGGVDDERYGSARYADSRYDDERYGDERYGDESSDRYDDERYARLEDEPPVAPRKRRLPRTNRSDRAAVRSRDSWNEADAPDVAVSDRAADSFDSNPPQPEADRSPSNRRRPLNVKPAPANYGGPYGDEPPAAASDYADYRPLDDDYPVDGEEDNSDYQQPY
ncbi:MAG: Ycf66 family protein [Elainellaceae cyanobacterium]